MSNFEKIAQTPEALGAFLAQLPIATGPWDAAFDREFCAGCGKANCDAGKGCPHEPERSNPTWWLGLEANDEA